MPKVFLDAGHGGKDSGAVGNGLKEKDLNLTMAKKVGEILTNEYENVTVLYSRTTDKTVSLKERTDMANKANSDYFFSIHVNAGGGTGYEDYVYNGKIQSTTESNRITIHNEVVKVLNKYGIKNRGRKRANFHVLRETRMPAMLVETLFIDNVNDAKILKNQNFINDISRAYATGIAKALGLKEKPKSQPKQTGKLYKVQVGAFSKRENAEKLLKELKAKGYDAIIKVE